MYKKLSTIQKRNNLNDVYVGETVGHGNGRHKYVIVPTGEPRESIEIADDAPDAHLCAALCEVQFQNGARKDENATHGVLDCDLLEIVRDRLAHFQAGEFATRENALALTHVEQALMWLNKRVEDRAERQVLGTYNK